MKGIVPITAFAEWQLPIGECAHGRGRALTSKPSKGVEFGQFQQLGDRIQAAQLLAVTLSRAAGTVRIVAKARHGFITLGRTARHPFRRFQIIGCKRHSRAAHAKKSMREIRAVNPAQLINILQHRKQLNPITTPLAERRGNRFEVAQRGKFRK